MTKYELFGHIALVVSWVFIIVVLRYLVKYWDKKNKHL